MKRNMQFQVDVFPTGSAAPAQPPPASDNTPEKFEKFMREEIARQGALADLSGQKIAQPK